MRRLHPCVMTCFLVGTFCLGFPVGAVNPSDDDGGSGGDAGDDPLFATPMAPGLVAGRLTAPHDHTDWYRFDGRFGDFVVFHIGSDAEGLVPFVTLHGPKTLTTTEDDLYQVGYGGHSMRFLLPENGTWFLNLKMNPASASTVEYVVDFTLEARHGVRVLQSSEPSFAFELRMDEPSDVWVFLRVVAHERPVGVPSATTLLQDVALETPTPVPFAGNSGMRLWRSGMGDSWQLDAVDASGQVPVGLSVPRGDGMLVSILYAESAVGFVRFVPYFTGHQGHVELVFWTSGESTWAAAPGGPVTAYRNADLAGADMVVPGLAQEGTRSLQASLSRDTVGWAAGGGAVVQATGPGGTSYASRPAPADLLPFYRPAAGSWSLVFEPPLHAAEEADQIWFDHASVPDLGVAGAASGSLPADLGSGAE